MLTKRWLKRRDFLTLVGKVVLGTAVGTKVMGSRSLAATLELPWTTDYAYLLSLDPKEVSETAYWGYYGYYDGKGCAYGVFNAIVSVVNQADVNYQLPEEMLTYGKGGMMGFGHICGTLNASSAVVNLIAGGTPIKTYLKEVLAPLVKELILWYAQEEHPQYKPPNPKVDIEIPTITPGSALCHAFVTKWCALTGYTVHSDERHECCARLAGEVAGKVVELLQTYLQGEFNPEHDIAPSARACLRCHGENGLDNVQGKMNCILCHKKHRHRW